MYTQCPECGTAFRVTAEVLRQAAGRVRCGGCGNAFNALDFLSEDKPAAPVPPVHEDGPAGEATEPPRLEADEPPETISAERSAALLKTLDELAGSDIRIEDTGIEWRVLDADDEEEAPQALEDGTPLHQLLRPQDSSRHPRVMIGGEPLPSALGGCSVVAATYYSGGQPLGSVAILGPTRLHYARAIALVECMARVTSKLFTQLRV